MKSFFNRANAVYVGIIHLFAYLSVALLVIITAWISLEVVSRLLGFGTLRGSVEFTEYAIFSMAFLAAPWVLHQNAHVKVLVLVEQLPGRSRLIAERGAHLVSAALCLILLYYATLNLNTSIQRAELVFGELVFPEWYLHWQAPFAFAFLAIGFLKNTVSGTRNTARDLIKE